MSSIAVGPAADRELLHNIAKWGKGRDYIVQNAKELPEIFVKEAKNAADAVVRREGDQAGREGAGVPRQRVDATHAPQLKGLTATVLKDTALEVLSTDDGDPLLAFWPIGLGPHRGVRLGRQGSLGGELDQVARLRAVLCRGRARDRTPASAADRSRRRCRPDRARAARDELCRSRRATPTVAIAT